MASPSHLRAAAASLRATADAIEAAFADLVELTGPPTWEGPAATVTDRGAARRRGDAEEVAATLRRVSVGLDGEADQREREAAEAERRRRLDAARDAWAAAPGPSPGLPSDLDVGALLDPGPIADRVRSGAGR